MDVAKRPFMPRIAVCLDHWLVTSASPALDQVVAAVAILLSFYFGWRSSTVGALAAEHVVCNLHDFTFAETFCKGIFSGTRRYRVLALPKNTLHNLDKWLPYIVSLHREGPLLAHFFAIPNKLQASLSAVAPIVGPDIS